MSDEEKKRKLENQAKTNEYHKFVEGNFIIKQGILMKRKVRDDKSKCPKYRYMDMEQLTQWQ